jgi:hypothetical protein
MLIYQQELQRDYQMRLCQLADAGTISKIHESIFRVRQDGQARQCADIVAWIARNTSGEAVQALLNEHRGLKPAAVWDAVLDLVQSPTPACSCSRVVTVGGRKIPGSRRGLLALLLLACVLLVAPSSTAAHVVPSAAHAVPSAAHAVPAVADGGATESWPGLTPAEAAAADKSRDLAVLSEFTVANWNIYPGHVQSIDGYLGSSTLPPATYQRLKSLKLRLQALSLEWELWTESAQDGRYCESTERLAEKVRDGKNTSPETREHLAASKSYLESRYTYYGTYATRFKALEDLDAEFASQYGEDWIRLGDWGPSQDRARWVEIIENKLEYTVWKIQWALEGDTFKAKDLRGSKTL